MARRNQEYKRKVVSGTSRGNMRLVANKAVKTNKKLDTGIYNFFVIGFFLVGFCLYIVR